MALASLEEEMSISELEELLNPYEGQNRAHRIFREEFKYLNAMYYLVVSDKDSLRRHLESKMARMDKAAGPSGASYALGIVTHVISGTQFQGVSVPKPDAKAMLDHFNRFIDLLNRHSIIAAHRAIIDFATDLLIELEEQSRITITPSQRENLHQRRLRPSKLAEQLEKIGEPLHADTEVLRRLCVLGEMRNLLEHNAGRATQEYVRLTGDRGVAPGDQVRVTGKDVGEAFALINSTAASLNRRVVRRFNL